MFDTFYDHSTWTGKKNTEKKKRGEYRRKKTKQRRKEKREQQGSGKSAQVVIWTCLEKGRRQRVCKGYEYGGEVEREGETDQYCEERIHQMACGKKGWKRDAQDTAEWRLTRNCDPIIIVMGSKLTTKKRSSLMVYKRTRKKKKAAHHCSTESWS